MSIEPQVDGYWRHGQFHWGCPGPGEGRGCRNAMVSAVPPQPEHALCLGCRAESMTGLLQRMCRDLACEISRLRVENERLAHALGEAEDNIHELQKMAERAHTEPEAA